MVFRFDERRSELAKKEVIFTNHELLFKTENGTAKVSRHDDSRRLVTWHKYCILPRKDR